MVNDKAPKDRDIAMVFQSYALYPHMTVGENMAFPLVLAGVDKGTIKTKVDDAAEMLELTNHLDRKPANLSGGQRQRVAMGRAIVRSPKAFLMDEPLSNLDAKLRVQMRTQVSTIQKTLATTTLYVTHDQTEAMTLGDRVVVMRGGDRPAGRITDVAVRGPEEPVRGRLHRQPVDELPAGDDRGRHLSTAVSARSRCPTASAGPSSRARARRSSWACGPSTSRTPALVGDAPGATFTVPIDLVESMGSDVYAYFTVRGEAHSRDLDDLAKDMGQDMHGEGTQVTARLDAAANVRPGQQAELWVNTEKMHVFDVETGANLTSGDAAGVSA